MVMSTRRTEAEGEASVRLIASRASVEIMRAADWLVVRNNTVHRRGVSIAYLMAVRVLPLNFPSLLLARNCQDTKMRACTGFACESLFSFHRRAPNTA